MKLIKSHTLIKKISKEDDSYVKASPKERISFVWGLTKELWLLRGEKYVKRRLQRNITNLIKK